MEQAQESGGLDGECVKYVDEMLAWPNRLNEHCDKADERHVQERAVVEKHVIQKKKQFDAKVRELQNQLEVVHNWTSLKQCNSLIDKVHNFHSEVDELERLKQEISTEENLLHGFKSDFSALQVVVRFFDPYYEMWTRINDIMTKKTNWAQSKLSEIEADDVAQLHKESVRSLQKLQKDFDKDKHV